MQVEQLRGKLKKAFEDRHMMKSDMVTNARVDTVIQVLESNDILQNNYFYGIIHNRREFFMEKDGQIYGHEYNSKKKRFEWYLTIMDDNRRKRLKRIGDFAEVIGLIK